MAQRTHCMPKTFSVALELCLLGATPCALVWCALTGFAGSAGISFATTVLSLVCMFASFEQSAPKLRQLMPTCVLAAAAAAGRILFAPIPDVKPVSAIAVVAGACLGRRSGFVVGALAALLSNAFFGQGPWTPWQMYAWGAIGYMAGLIAKKGWFNRKPLLYAYGLASGLFYGAILNAFYIVGYVHPITAATIVAALAAALPLDILHGVATLGFLALIWESWGTKIKRCVIRYGLSAEG